MRQIATKRIVLSYFISLSKTRFTFKIILSRKAVLRIHCDVWSEIVANGNGNAVSSSSLGSL